MKVEFTILGEPVPKGRPRLSKWGGTFTPPKTREYENLVAKSYNGKTLNGAISADIRAYFPIPSSLSKCKKGKLVGQPVIKRNGDLDNIIKSILDGLNGVAYDDDSQIWSINGSKTYDELPRVEVTLTETEGL